MNCNVLSFELLYNYNSPTLRPIINLPSPRLLQVLEKFDVNYIISPIPYIKSCTSKMIIGKKMSGAKSSQLLEGHIKVPCFWENTFVVVDVVHAYLFISQ